MHATTALFLGLVTSLPGAVLTVTDPVALRFAPAEGSAWTRTLVASHTTEWQGLEVEMDGRQVPQEYLPDFDLVATRDYRIVVHDQYVAMAEGRPARLRRHYEEVDCKGTQDFEMKQPMGGGGGGGDGDVSDSSKGKADCVLTGHTVEFAWEEGQGGFAASWHGEAPEAAVPKGLDEDMDLRALLPARAVAVGDTWQVKGAALKGLLIPGGELGLAWPEELKDFNQKQPREEAVDGEVTLELEGLDDSADAHLARIVFTGEARTDQTLEGDLSHSPVVQGKATETARTTFKVSGTLTWDLKAGLVRSLELAIETEHEMVTVADDPGTDYQHTVTLTGRGTVKLTCSPKR